MTEPIEKWREEFEAIFGPHAKYENGRYVANFDEWHWRGFLIAKCSQAVVELPRPEKTDHTDVAFYVQKVLHAITAAGINYRIKGE